MTYAITNRLFTNRTIEGTEAKPQHRRHPNRRNLDNLDFSHLFGEK